MLQIYTGNGKGKTTACIGQIIRLMGYGKKVVFSQYLKTTKTGELKFFSNIENIKIFRVEKEFPFTNKMTKEQLDEIKGFHNDVFDKAVNCFYEEEADAIVFDEIVSAYNIGLIDRKKVIEFINKTTDKLIIFTGRDVPKEFLEKADYISEIKNVRNPFDSGKSAKEGIEF